MDARANEFDFFSLSETSFKLVSSMQYFQIRHQAVIVGERETTNTGTVKDFTVYERPQCGVWSGRLLIENLSEQ